MKIIYTSVLFLGTVSMFYSQNTNDTISKESKIEEVSVTGSRNKKRTVTNTPVPVDIIDIKQVSQSTGQVEVNQLLQFSAPSFNSNKQSGSDGADAVDPATLRGLGPDQTLLLLNGKRYHQSSLINLFGTKGRGNTGSDMNTIPIGAIKRIEVLRDGASAQYGSDAIAGVINVILNDRNQGFEGNAFYGMNLFKSPGNKDVVSEHKIDGTTFDFSGNLGTKIGNNGGFGNFTVEFINKERTIRNANPDRYTTSREKFGDAKSQNFYFFGNIELPLSDGLKFYSRQGFSQRKTNAYAWTRTADADGNIPEVYPNGFNPIEDTSITDFTFDNGLKFKVADWDVDFYNAFGSNRFTYQIDNTINATLGIKSPTSFNAGGHSLLQNTTGFNAAKQFGVLHGLNIAFGSEFRYEQFEIIKGEEASYAMYDINGNIVTPNTPQALLVTNPLSGTTPLSIRPGGSQGFPGYSQEVNKNRNNFAAYVDTELDITKNWMISVAGRFENYSDFGSTLNGKFATRYAITPQFAFRGSVSTGFRAPSLAQKYYSLQFTNFQGGDLVTIQLASNDSDLAQAVGIPQLKQETSVNGSAGFTFNTGKFTATVDGYYIKVKDRIVLTGNFNQNDDAIGPILAENHIDQAQFFTNAMDTRTKGVDIIVSYTENLGNGKLSATLAGNYNEMEITKINTSEKLQGKENVYLSPRERAFILASAPKTKVNLNLNYKISKFNANVQLVRFDKVKLIGYKGADDYQLYGAKVTTDISFGYEFSKNLNLTIGSKNLFNRYPTLQTAHVDGNTESGGIFDPVQMGFAGRQAFARLNFKF
ncbi:TonB-dependent receptor plug domain-containing protein [Chryseobacterium vrystaatense]|uniref:Iron complex outermembrane recepter protein n=1 Tax=Chryseobacterium vrystaatense TaxID=307480 RepID=A0A1M4TSQ8_9FLAO|nr:TonB-dependent receptor [Chryseobacterium vrystaatense]SHE47434.1 iron complex outermembrane recepter protein [Chryseobacterium vrystaatense]